MIKKIRNYVKKDKILNPYYGDIESELTKMLSEELSKNIDRELTKMLSEELSKNIDREIMKDIMKMGIRGKLISKSKSNIKQQVRRIRLDQLLDKDN